MGFKTPIRKWKLKKHKKCWSYIDEKGQDAALSPPSDKKCVDSVKMQEQDLQRNVGTREGDVAWFGFFCFLGFFDFLIVVGNGICTVVKTWTWKYCPVFSLPSAICCASIYGVMSVFPQFQDQLPLRFPFSLWGSSTALPSIPLWWWGTASVSRSWALQPCNWRPPLDSTSQGSQRHHNFKRCHPRPTPLPLPQFLMLGNHTALLPTAQPGTMQAFLH